MMALVSNLRFTPASTIDASSGLLGWARFEFGGLRVDGVAVRRTRAGRHALSYPCRRDRSGREHAFVLPTSVENRQKIEQAVFGELRRQGVLR